MRWVEYLAEVAEGDDAEEGSEDWDEFVRKTKMKREGNEMMHTGRYEESDDVSE